MNKLVLEFNSTPGLLTKKVLNQGITIKVKKKVLHVNLTLDKDLLQSMSDKEIMEHLKKFLKN